MSKNTYLIISILAIMFGTFANYSMVGSPGAGSGSRGYHSGGGFGGFSGGHK